MKLNKSLQWSALVAMLLGSACSSDNSDLSEEPTVTPNPITLKAKISPSETRSEVSDEGIFTWSDDNTDQIAVYDAAAGQFATWTQTGWVDENPEEANFEAPDAETQVQDGAQALYPALLQPTLQESTLSVTLPAEYDHNQAAPILLAAYDEESGLLSFSHLAALMRISLYNVPASATKFVFEAEGAQIAGTFEVQTADGVSYIETQAGEEQNLVTIHLTSSDVEEGKMVFNIPLPVGVYDGFKMQLYAGDDLLYSKATTAGKRYDVQRRTLLRMPDVFLIGGNASISMSAADTILVHEKTISVRMPYGADVTALRATFTAPEGTEIALNGTPVEGGAATQDFSEPVILTLGSTSYTMTVAYSDLPIVYLTTPDHQGITSKTTYVEKSTFVMGNTEGGKQDLTVSEAMNIKGRGNSTWSYPKKPYAIKFEKKQSILGLPNDKSWVLLANWMDRTVMRNAVAFTIAKKTKALGWTPNGDFVDVVLNGKFIGNYYLCEKIKISSDRVDIAEIDNTKTVVTEGDDLTGGYLVELDTYYDEDFKFKTATRSLPVNFKAPDEAVPDEQINYLKGYFDNLESILYASDFPTETGNYEELIDVDSFIDWWFVHELTQNAEPNHPKSSYMHKDRLGKLVAGPVWDFDWGTFMPNVTSFSIKSAIYYNALFKDPAFVARVKEKWAESKADFESVAEDIDEIYEHIRLSATYNGTLWPISQTTNGDVALSYDDAVARLRSTYVARIQTLNALIAGL
jgi:hypothetical protein